MTGTTPLFRQVHPAWVQDGNVTSQAFRPTPKDRKMLSAYDGDLISAGDAWVHFTANLGLESAGVLAVTVTECQDCSLPVLPDPVTFAEHVLIDFSGLTENQTIRTGKWLKACAEARGWQFRTDR